MPESRSREAREWSQIGFDFHSFQRESIQDDGTMQTDAYCAWIEFKVHGSPSLGFHRRSAGLHSAFWCSPRIPCAKYNFSNKPDYHAYSAQKPCQGSHVEEPQGAKYSLWHKRYLITWTDQAPAPALPVHIRSRHQKFEHPFLASRRNRTDISPEVVKPSPHANKVTSNPFRPTFSKSVTRCR